LASKLTDQNGRKVREWMSGWKREGKVRLQEEEREALATKLRLRSTATKDEAILQTIARVYRENPRGDEGGSLSLSLSLFLARAWVHVFWGGRIAC